MSNEFKITSTHNIEEPNVVKYLGVISTNIVSRTRIFSDIVASFTGFFAGITISYQKTLQNISKLLVFFFIAAIFFISPIQMDAQSNSNQIIVGNWLGKLEIPNAAVIRMGIIVDKDGSSALNIIDQATGNIPMDEVLIIGDTVTFKINDLGITIKGHLRPDKDSIPCIYMQRGGRFALNLRKVDQLPQLKRPQTPKAPFGYISEEIELQNKMANVKLAGTLTLPKTSSKVPVVVLLTGSGKQGRNQDIAGHKPFWVIADYLTRHGIAVLRLDDRGFGGSSGDFNNSTTGDFASDALAAVEYLKNRKDIDVNQIGLIGHSEGGATALITASQSNDVKFIISLSGVILNFGEIVISQLTDRLESQNVPNEIIELEMEWRRKLYSIVKESTDSILASEKMWKAYRELSEEDIKRMNWPEGRMNHIVSQLLSPWWRYSISLDVLDLYMEIDCPALLLFGEKDVQVSAIDNMPLIEEAVKFNNKNNIEIQLIEGVNHLYQTADTGSEYEYVQIEETISPNVLNLISNWILKDKN
ncbi:alpha/beta fold hydrolase [Aestuariivivens sediminicola]|uniref:alpha/beta fold hydrolase n=1 Tax=Aestuariivivens sediminicola TaxID=2913560 RepID=UPI001F5A02CC|nr:alpha/beta fold hydrolase [Aestuariivivens sediminicola]